MCEITERLTKLAWKKSKPFCYGCYKEAPSGKCATCYNDDLMRLVDGVGVEYGIDWVVRHLVSSNLEPIDSAKAFEESLEGVYPETTQVGWLKLDTISTMKEADPVSFALAESEWVDAELSEGNLVTFDNGGSHFRAAEVEEYLDHEEAA